MFGERTVSVSEDCCIDEFNRQRGRKPRMGCDDLLAVTSNHGDRCPGLPGDSDPQPLDVLSEPAPAAMTLDRT